jgi:ABC-type Fe3+ transport system permease subunit
LQVTLPLSMPGVISAFAFIFLLAAGDFVTPELVGGINGMMIGNAVATVRHGQQTGRWGGHVLLDILVFLLALAALLAVRRAARREGPERPGPRARRAVPPPGARVPRPRRDVPLLNLRRAGAAVPVSAVMMLVVLVQFRGDRHLPAQGFTLKCMTGLCTTGSSGRRSRTA